MSQNVLLTGDRSVHTHTSRGIAWSPAFYTPYTLLRFSTIKSAPPAGSSHDFVLKTLSIGTEQPDLEQSANLRTGHGVITQCAPSLGRESVCIAYGWAKVRISIAFPQATSLCYCAKNHRGTQIYSFKSRDNQWYERSSCHPSKSTRRHRDHEQ